MVREFPPPGSFMVSFPSHSVKIGPKNAGSDLVLSMYDEYGRVFEETVASSAGMTKAGSPVLGRRLLELFQLVQASTEKDGELDKLLQELG